MKQLIIRIYMDDDTPDMLGETKEIASVGELARALIEVEDELPYNSVRFIVAETR